jgi:hypothetical protein
MGRGTRVAGLKDDGHEEGMNINGIPGYGVVRPTKS